MVMIVMIVVVMGYGKAKNFMRLAPILTFYGVIEYGSFEKFTFKFNFAYRGDDDRDGGGRGDGGSDHDRGLLQTGDSDRVHGHYHDDDVRDHVHDHVRGRGDRCRVREGQNRRLRRVQPYHERLRSYDTCSEHVASICYRRISAPS